MESHVTVSCFHEKITVTTVA